MRVVFMGTPDFAVPSLVALHSAHEVLAVYTRPDAVSGRGGALRPSPVKTAAMDMGLPVEQPATLRDSAVRQRLGDLRPDVVVVAAYGMILPPEVLTIPPKGCINVHASLLPRWRGAAPIERAVLSGDSSVGVSIMLMEAGLDTGPYCVQAAIEVDALAVPELTGRLAELGATSLVQALAMLEEGACRWIEQDESRVTYAEKIDRDDVALEPGLAVDEAMRRIRASSRRAPARVLISDKGVTVLDGAPSGHAVAPGRVLSTKEGIELGFSDGGLRIDRIKPDGRGEMSALDWARGARLADDASWGPLL